VLKKFNANVSFNKSGLQLLAVIFESSQREPLLNICGSTLIVSKTEVLVAEKTVKKDKSASKTKEKEEHYYVQKGDSLYKIAKKYPGITVSDIKKWNGISNENLKPGMKLKISG
jgi:membrane-bound lytic murein transglycosylase D